MQLHNDFIVNAQQSSVCRMVGEVRAIAWARCYDDALQITRGASRAWNTNNPAILRDWVETLMVLIEDQVGAYDDYARLREIASAIDSLVAA